MNQGPDDYEIHYRWEWFRREDWRKSFRQAKQHSSGGFVELLREHGLDKLPVLDCSCGLGLKTIVIKEAGMNVHGSDRCAFAVEHARLLADEEGHSDLPYFVASWDELPARAPTRYAAIFNDALSWIHSDHEMDAGLRGLHGCLRPGGLLAYMGALPGTDTDQAAILQQAWEEKTANGRCRLGFQAGDERLSVREVVCFERGGDFIDEHHALVIQEDGRPRLENWSLRCPIKWSWPRMEEWLRQAGFVSFKTQPFIAANGRPFHLVVAQRD